MARDTSIIVLGVLIALTPFLGLPGIWKTSIIVFFALLVALLGLIIRTERSLPARNNTHKNPPRVVSPEHEEKTEENES